MVRLWLVHTFSTGSRYTTAPEPLPNTHQSPPKSRHWKVGGMTRHDKEPLKNRRSQKETIVFQPSIFRGKLAVSFGCYVSFREGKDISGSSVRIIFLTMLASSSDSEIGASNNLIHRQKLTLQGTNVYHLGKRNIFKSALKRKYVSSLEGKTNCPMLVLSCKGCTAIMEAKPRWTVLPTFKVCGLGSPHHQAKIADDYCLNRYWMMFV